MKKGQIEYNLYTISGTKTVIVHYEIETIDRQVKGTVSIESDERLDIPSEEFNEIMDLCLKDSMHKPEHKNMIDDFIAAKGYDFTVN